MVSDTNQKEVVISLRKNGLTLSEISKETGLRKGTISRWLKGIIFDVEVRQKILNRQKEQKVRGLTKLRLAKEMKKKFGARTALIEAKHSFEKYKKEPLFIAGIALYWADGSTKNNYFQFSTSDEIKALLMIDWLNKFSKVSGDTIRFRLFSPILMAKENQIFWAKYVGSIKKMALSTYPTQNKRKKDGNKGFLQILCYDISLQQKVIFWQNLLVEYYKKH